LTFEISIMPPEDFQRLTFAKQLEYFRQKEAIPAETLEGVRSEYHDWAFSVSRLTRADLVRDVMSLVDRAIADGMTHEQFQEQFYRLIGRRGWTPVTIDRSAPPEKQLAQLAANNRRLYTILDTNHRRSYAAGRIQQMRQPELLKLRPYWRWQWRDSVAPREHHQAINGKVFRADEEFWEHCFPTCGFGCRCSVMSLSEADMKRLGLRAEKPPDWRTFVEKGFERSAGLSPIRDRASFIRQGLSKQSPTLRAVLEKELEGI
jgi:SPP1 gp7 family putative phage head morphogenesis protein